MIEFVEGDLFESGAEALVNTVNCVGVMGAGIALEFKKRFPRMFVEYQRACRGGLLKPGEVHCVKVADQNPQWVINFATKDDWRKTSKIEWIEYGLGDLRRWIRSVAPASIAIPALGCGCGDLEYSKVKPLIVQRLGDLDLKILVYPPQGRHNPV